MGLIPSEMDIIEFVEAGASGFILKDSSVKELLATIRSVAQGENVLPPPLTGSIFSYVVDHALKKHKGPTTTAICLTKREREIIAQLSVGKCNKEIATQFNISIHTVKSHIHNIMEKLALHSRLQIATLPHRVS